MTELATSQTLPRIHIWRPGERRRSILTALERVPFFTEAQIGRGFFSDTPQGLASARKLVRRLAGEGALSRLTVLAHPEITLRGPLHCQTPGNGVPDVGALEHACRTRFAQPVQKIRAWSLSDAARVERTGSTRASHSAREHQATHNLALGTVFLYLGVRSAEARTWISEGQMKGDPGDRIPDALVQDDTGRPRAIEFGGPGTSATRIFKLFCFCLKYDLPWEIW